MRTLKLVYYLYYLIFAFIAVAVLYASMFYFWVLLLFTTAILALLAGFGKIRVETAAGILLNIAVLSFFFLFTPRRLTPDVVELIQKEKYARPVFMFTDIYTPKQAKAYSGLIKILTSSDDRYVYFTAKDREKKNKPHYFSLYKIDLENPKKIMKWSHDRLYDLALTENDTKLLVTDYRNARLWVLDAKTLRPIRSVPVRDRPENIVLDSERKRVIVTHEGLTSYLILSLPGLKRIKSVNTSSCPGWMETDPYRERMYSANCCIYPYLMSEIDMSTLRPMRRRLLMHFFSLGAGMDRKLGRIYITHIITGTIHVLDMKTLKIIGIIRTLPGVRAVATDTRRNLIYVGSMTDPYFRVYDTKYKYLGKIYIGRTCREIHVSAKKGRVYAGSMYGLIEVRIDDFMKEIAKRR